MYSRPHSAVKYGAVLYKTVKMDERFVLLDAHNSNVGQNHIWFQENHHEVRTAALRWNGLPKLELFTFGIVCWDVFFWHQEKNRPEIINERLCVPIIHQLAQSGIKLSS